MGSTGATTVSITIFSITTFSVKVLYVTLCKNDNQHKNTAIMLSVVMLNVIMLSVVMPNDVILSVVMPNDVILSVVMLNVAVPFYSLKIRLFCA
jgi:hypothetical protein